MDQRPISVLDTFARTVREEPERLAVRDASESLTRAELDARASSIARAVRSATDRGPVALLASHGVDVIAGMLGILRSGRPLVMLDPMLPAQRLATILDRAEAGQLVVDADNHGTGEAVAGHRTLAPLETLVRENGGTHDLPVPAPKDTAAILFTSGSSGEPKGVVVTHEAMGVDAHVAAQAYLVQQDDRLALVIPASFAMGALMANMALVAGASIHLEDPRRVGARRAVEFLMESRATILPATPSLVRGLARAMAEGERLDQLRKVIASGEAGFGGDMAQLQPFVPSTCTYANQYGSSEAMAISHIELPLSGPAPEGALPAGKPFAHKELVLSDESGRPVPDGTPGRLTIRSRFLASGYWGDEEQTRAKFRTDETGVSEFETGDMARLDEHGVLTVLGRADSAVKIGGYLVHPSEVEATLLTSPLVSEAVVIAVAEGGTSRLVAYVQPEAGVRVPSAAQLRWELAARLPTWMIPAHFVFLATMPRTERGKVDRQSLPPVPARVVEPPTTDWERMVARVWARTLGLDSVGRNEDFNELGGDSLAVEEMLVQLEKEAGIRLRTTDFVQAPVLSQFASRVAALAESSAGPASRTAVPLRSGSHPLNLFCFAGAGGSSLIFLQLAKLMPEAIGVRAFQAPGFEGRALAIWSVKRLARRHLAELRRVQPHGPYLLLGHSLGARVALEVAHELRAQGEEVPLVVLSDLVLGGNHAREPGPARTKDAEARTSQESWRQLVRHGQVRKLAERAVREGKVWAAVPFAGILDFPTQFQEDVFWHQGRLLARFHRLRPWAGRTLVFHTQANWTPPEVWPTLLTGDHRVCLVPSNHNGLMREPHVLQVATEIRRDLEELSLLQQAGLPPDHGSAPDDGPVPTALPG